MKSPKNRFERRRFPRIKRQIPLKIKLDDYDLVGYTRDLSCIGTYCTVDRYIPPFSIISIVLLLPLKTNTSDGVSSVHCQGAVVRTEINPQNRNEYNIAVYFNRLKQSDKAKLLQYVQQYL